MVQCGTDEADVIDVKTQFGLRGGTVVKVEASWKRIVICEPALVSLTANRADGAGGR